MTNDLCLGSPEMLISSIPQLESGGVVRPLDAQFFHPRPECARVDVKDLRRPPVASDAPVGLLEDLKDMIAFCFFERRRACGG